MYERFFKRLIDIVLALIGSVVLLPVSLIIAIAIFIDDPGPVFFKQKRFGKNKKFFMLHKFRSMKVKTPDNKPFHMYKFRSMQLQSEADEKKGWTTKDDPRVTKVGKFIRRTSLDELPQIYCDILTGKMSIIGPRPALWNQDDLIAERDKYGANDIKPGLTGWAQVNGYRGDTSIRKRIDYDLYYIENWTFGFDIRIIFLTIFKGFVNKNAY